MLRYYNGPATDHFYTTVTDEVSPKNGKAPLVHSTHSDPGNTAWIYEGVQGYIYASPGIGLAPLYRYWQGVVADHFYTTNVGEIGTPPGVVGNHGYAFEGIIGYVQVNPDRWFVEIFFALLTLAQW
jgi:hypothetical protein